MNKREARGVERGWREKGGGSEGETGKGREIGKEEGTRERTRGLNRALKDADEDDKAVPSLTASSHWHCLHSQGGMESVQLPAQTEKCPNSKHPNEGRTLHP